MPLYPPRTEPIKKREQLLSRAKELQIAIKKNESELKIAKLVKKYRLAQLSFFKAQLHELHEKELQKKNSIIKIEKIEAEVLNWTNKTDLEIINDIKKS
ncbi:hypothetical protein [Ferruginibacter profundus]